MAKVTLEISIKCMRLQLPHNFSDGISVAVHHCQPNHDFWINHSETDIIRGSSNPIFLKTISFFSKDNISENTRLRFIVYKVLKNKDRIELGACYSVVGDLTSREDLKLDLQESGNFTGTLLVEVVHAIQRTKKQLIKQSSSGKTVLSVDASLAESVRPKSVDNSSISTNLTLKSMFSNAICCTYKFPCENERSILVEELMLETSLSFNIPILFLKLLVDEETRKIGSLESIGKLTGHWEAVRRRRVESIKKYLDRYQARVKHVQLLNKSPYFKKSVDKTSEDLEFLPTNLHVQKMTVKNSSTESTADSSDTAHRGHNVNYDFTTVGATTAHAIGYKHGGGLLALIANAGDAKSRKNLPLTSMSECLKRRGSTQQSKASQYLKQIGHFHKQIMYEAEKLRNFTKHESGLNAFSSDRVTGSSEALSHLSKKVFDLVAYCESEFVQDAVRSLEAASPSYKPLYNDYVHGPPNGADGQEESSVLVDMDDNVTFNSSTASSVAEYKADNLWDELTITVQLKLANVAKSINMVTTPDTEAAFLRGEATTDDHREAALTDLSALLTLVDKLCTEVNSSLYFIDLRRTESPPELELEYRRNIVFSQALTAVVVAVQNHILTSIDDELKLHQFSEVGILVQVESLLSTYGNELGMLQDYAVGIDDMRNVAIKCAPASKNTNEDRYSPVLFGSTSSMIVTLHFDDASFHLLPVDIQKGKFIKLHPVLYNIGINEEQTLAEKFGSTAVQEYLNHEAIQSTFTYYDLIRDQCPNSLTEKLRNANSFIHEVVRDKMTSSFPEKKKPTSPDEHQPIMELLIRLKDAVDSKRNKNVEILQKAGDVCRRLNGVRLTSCKSAKDRTAMSVTLEQVRILTMEHGLAAHAFNQALSCMRSRGTRLENTLKNVGSRRFAFTSMQLLTFPKLYRAPEGTYGKAES